MPRPSERLLAVDWLRGIVMVLMALDHVDHATNPNHAQGDGAMFAAAGPLSAPDFTIRWLTHLCAPAFVLLAGVSVALSAASARERGRSPGAFDRHLMLRGAVLVALELSLVSGYWRVAEGLDTAWLPVFPLVLWAIGGCLLLMPLFRRLPDGVLLATAAALLVLAELAPTADFAQPGSLPTTVLMTGGLWWADADTGRVPDVICTYPLLPWLPVMLFGVVLGRRLVAGRVNTGRLAIVGLACLLLFVVLRGIDGFGNMDLHRRSNALLEWLHCSKYPPSITFLALELGLAALLLALLTRGERLLARLPDGNPIALLGRVPLFYYLLHLPMIGLLLHTGLLPGRGDGSATKSLLGTVAVVAACWPLCGAYAWYKARYRHTWTRLL